MAVLESDNGGENFVAVSVYDNKPVYFMSSFSKTICWVMKQRKVWSNRMQHYITLNFIRLNINDDYNNFMGKVDVSDQLRNVYRLMRGSRKSK